MEETFIIVLLRPFFTNKTSELKKNPKVYFIDSGLRNYILDNFQELARRSDTGQLVENTMLDQIKIAQEETHSVYYWRTIAKAEVDFIIKKENEVIPISRGFRSFLSEYRLKRAVVFSKNFWGELKVNSTLVKFIPVYYL